MKKLWLILAASCLFFAGYYAHGQPTNKVTLGWTPPLDLSIPMVYELEQTVSLAAPNWVIIASNIPSSTTNYLVTNLNKAFYAWRIRSVNATNSAWKTDFSNTATTLWPGRGGQLTATLTP